MTRPLPTTSLTKFAGSMRDADPATARKLAAELWQKHGAVVVFPEQLRAMAGLERQLFEAVAAKHYGKRGGRA